MSIETAIHKADKLLAAIDSGHHSHDTVSQAVALVREMLQALSNYEADAIHTCGPDCKRPTCEMRAELADARYGSEQWYKIAQASSHECERLHAELAALRAQKPVAWIETGQLAGGIFKKKEWCIGPCKPLYAAPAPAAVPDEVDLWSFLRSVLKRGAAIESQFSQQGYETFVSEIDAAARTEEKKLRAMLAATQEGK